MKNLKLTNIRRQYYDEYDTVFSLQKNTHGGALDKMLSDALAKLKDNGKFQEIMGDFMKDTKYSDWQP